jgi:chaperonin GroEL
MMIKEDNLYIGEEARSRIMKGVQKAAQAVGITLGTSGSNSLIEVMERPGHFATNDGATILGSIKFADPLEEIGRMVLFEAVSRANKSSGDGSSTATVLTSAILEEGMKHIGEVSPMEIKRSLEACIPLIEESIKSQTKEITVDSVAQVAAISAEDEGIGKMIQEIYQQIGKDGIIQWDISKTAEDSYSIGSGLTINGATYAAPYMCDDNSTEVRLTDPYVLLARKKITTALDFETLFPMLFAQEIKEVVVFCEDMDVQVIADLYKTQRIRGFRTIVIKMPVLWRDEWWEDLAIASGGTLVDMASGIKINEVQMQHLGRFGHITVTREETLIDGVQDMTSQIVNLQGRGEEKDLIRAARLNTRTARYFVGAQSESALAYRRLKVEDSINAASCALEHGIVPGGGLALHNASDELMSKESSIGSVILRNALEAPIKQIVYNTGKDFDDIVGYIGATKGFNSKTGELVDMFETGIVDPADVVLNAVRNAIGVAAAILTVGTVVTLPKEEPIQTPQNMVQRR